MERRGGMGGEWVVDLEIRSDIIAISWGRIEFLAGNASHFDGGGGGGVEDWRGEGRGGWRG